MRPFLLPPLRALLYAHWMATHFSAALYPMRSLPKRSSSTPAGRYLLHKLQRDDCLASASTGSYLPPEHEECFHSRFSAHTRGAGAGVGGASRRRYATASTALTQSSRAARLPFMPAGGGSLRTVEDERSSASEIRSRLWSYYLWHELGNELAEPPHGYATRPPERAATTAVGLA